MEAVIQASLQEFSRCGYSHASTNRICEMAGVSKGALFHNFHSKENLFFFLIQDGMRIAERVFCSHMESQSRATPFQTVFVDSFFVLLHFVKKYPNHYNIYLRLIYDPDIPEKDRRQAKEVMRTFTASISDTLVREGKQRGLLKSNLNEILTKFLFNTVITRFVELYFFPLRDPGLDVGQKTEEELTGEILALYRLLMDGLGSRSEG
jgi:AcrR family transcriptional regulator